jgi:hypothetical protein
VYHFKDKSSGKEIAPPSTLIVPDAALMEERMQTGVGPKWLMGCGGEN